MRDRPSETASSPAACGASSGRAVSAPRTISASRCERRQLAEAELLDHDSKVQSSPRWLQNTPSTSNGVAPKRSATPAPRPARRTGRRLRDRRSGGSATGRRYGRPWAGRGSPRAFGLRVARRQLGLGHHRQAGGRPGHRAAFQDSAATPSWRSQAATPWLSFDPFWQTTTAERPCNSGAQSRDVDVGAADRARDETRIGGEVLVGPDVDDERAVGRADQAGKLVGRNGVDRGHAASLSKCRTRCFGMSPHGVIAIPISQLHACDGGLSSGAHKRPLSIRSRAWATESGQPSCRVSPLTAERPARAHSWRNANVRNGRKADVLRCLHAVPPHRNDNRGQ